MKKAALLITGVLCALVAVTAGTAGVQALITSAQIKDGTIQSRDIKNGAIARADMSQAAVNALRGQRGPAGAAGPAGAQGPQGATGPQGPQGATGAQGPQGATGPAGPKGDSGAGVHVTGSVPTSADLPAEASLGDAYIALDTGHLHVWDGETFVDTGPVQGPKGDKGDQGDTGPAGPKGDQGAQGPQGPAGADGGLVGYEVVPGTHVDILGSDFDVSASVPCPGTKVAIGGGIEVDVQDGGVLLVESHPTGGGAGWGLTVLNLSDEPNGMTPYAICASTA